MNTSKYLPLREKILDYLHFSYAGMEKNAFHALFEDNPFTPDKWKKFYDLVRNNRWALFELYLLFENWENEFLPTTSLLIKEDGVTSSLSCPAFDLTMSLSLDGKGTDSITWDNTTGNNKIICDLFEIDDSLCGTFDKMTSTMKSLLRLYVMVKIDNRRPILDEDILKAFGITITSQK